MKRALVTSSLFLFLITLTGCRSGGGDLSQAETQRRFGVRMAKMELWREAMFRFRRATEIEPANAMAHNNLAVAYEATGDYEAALREYREALRLDRTNEYIQKNYSRFVEFSQRSKKREAAASATAAGTPASAPPLATPPPVVGGDVQVKSAPAPTPTAGQPAVTPPPQQPPVEAPPIEAPPPPATDTNPPEER